MIDRLRTLVVALCVAPLALPVSACSQEPDVPGNRRNRIVCTSAGRVVFDDFSKRGTGMDGGGIYFTSLTTGERSRVIGECVAYMADVPAGWKATLPAPDPNATTVTTVNTLDDGSTVTSRETLP